MESMPSAKIKPRITIITVVFNGEQHLEKTILSIINQTYENLEYIIIDGCSTDGTLTIVENYRYAISYFISEPDQGIYDAMNKGINIASGEWVNFMNAGDVFYDTNTLNNITPHLEKTKDVVYGNHVIFQEHPYKETYFMAKNLSYVWNIPYCHQTAFVSISLLRKHLFDTQYHIASDYNQYLDMRKANAIFYYTPIFIAKYLDGGVSAQHKQQWIKEHRIIQSNHFKVRGEILYHLRILKMLVEKQISKYSLR